jgi:hypothetical protein
MIIRQKHSGRENPRRRISEFLVIGLKQPDRKNAQCNKFVILSE